MTRFAAIALTPALVLAAASVSAAPVVLSPGDINGSDTNTASFTDGKITLTPYLDGVQDTFNGNASRLGIDGNSTNNNAFADADTDADNAGKETLGFVFTAGYGLQGISWDFSRADGPGAQDGVFISGFTADPLATLGGAGSGAVTNPNTFSYDIGTGTLQIDITSTHFGDPDSFVTFGNLSASDGQTLVLSVSDTTQAGAQIAITSISYEAVPEPGSLALLGLGGLLIARRRRG